MKKSITFAGLDVHNNSIAIAIALLTGRPAGIAPKR
jgi:hypothetical protein